MSKRCSRCHQFHSGACSLPQGVCFHYGQPRHLKKNYLKLAGISSGGQSLGQPRMTVQDYGRAAGRSLALVRSAAGSSSGNQGALNVVTRLIDKSTTT